MADLGDKVPYPWETPSCERGCRAYSTSAKTSSAGSVSPGSRTPSSNSSLRNRPNRRANKSRALRPGIRSSMRVLILEGEDDFGQLVGDAVLCPCVLGRVGVDDGRFAADRVLSHFEEVEEFPVGDAGRSL